ncbi:DNA-binding IclR family transcriptional regulator [Kibdelosporangium banguiense]|uniref:DNA-binding IclR family transcriptional regulator n=1 Tax=Kibdelosporangium banguiense TaxID=1365924 RepID=A0ABS4TSD2_9PSEU|nr:IclR family transcriptional regulator [Kibdelosporangium banguiense]MBP2326904.1 DNA-binding IclR family transcriptional regulator [Kibdelosporangium banguiense]
MVDERRSVLRRALRILDTFQEAGTGLSLSELSRRSGVPLTTTHRIVSELHEWGALERDDSGSYRIGLRLWEVAALAPRSVGLQRIALPFMQDLYETTHRGVHLAVREKDEVVFVERFVSPETAGERPRVGGRYALHATAVGLVLLAHAPVELQEEVLRGPLESFTSWTYSNGRELRQVLADVRRDGYAISDRQINPSYVSVAAPIYGPGSEIVASLSLIVPHTEPHGPSVAHLVQATARGISRELGGRPTRTHPYLSSDIRKGGWSLIR